mgnify:CR=1 FL=1
MPNIDVVPKTTAPRIQYVSLAMLGLKLIKSVKVVKAALAVSTIGAYAWMFTWEFAVALVAGLCIHEAGHLWAMKRCGLRTKGFYLIPFIGGAAISEGEVKSRWDEVFIAAMGPAWGLMSIIPITIAMGLITDVPTAAATASMLALINALNLLPICPLDGGRIVKSVVLSAHRKTGIALMMLSTLLAGFLLIGSGAILWAIVIVVSVLEIIFETRRDLPHMAMGWFAMVISILWWLGLGAVFILIVLVADHIPGADLAGEILRGN